MIIASCTDKIYYRHLFTEGKKTQLKAHNVPSREHYFSPGLCPNVLNMSFETKTPLRPFKIPLQTFQPFLSDEYKDRVKSSDLLQMLESHTTSQVSLNPSNNNNITKLASLGKFSQVIGGIGCNL